MAAVDQVPAEGKPAAESEIRLAEPGQRLLARIVDTLAVGLPVVMVVRELVPGTEVDVVAPPAVAASLLLYEWIQLAVWGRTLGKRVAGIEVVRAVPVAVPAQAGPEAATEPDPEAGPEAAGEAAAEPVRDGAVKKGERPGTARSLLRSATYALPIAARPVPVFGVIAGLVWVGNAALLYEGNLRQALHDRLAGTIVVKRGIS